MILTGTVAVFLVLIALRVPIAFGMLAAGIVGLLLEGGGISLQIVVQRMYEGTNSFDLLAIPLFILAGQIMSSGTMTQRLVRWTTAIFGQVPAGTATVDVVASMIFAGVSGSGTADMAAIGSVLIPRLVQRGYPRGVAAALEACAGAIGPIIPPSLLMIIYAGMADLSVGRLFLSGVVPGIVTGLGLIVVLQILNVRTRWEPSTGGWPSPREIAAATRVAWPTLIIPLIIVGGIASGAFTPSEAGAIAVAYAVLITLLQREFRLRAFWRDLEDATGTTVAVLLPVAAAALFGWLLALTQFGAYAVEGLLAVSQGNRALGALLVIVVVMLLGAAVDGLAVMVALVSVLTPVGASLGYDPVHWALVMVLTINLAGIMPPHGVGLFLCSAMANCSFEETCRHLPPFFLVMLAVVLLTLFAPDIVLWLPNKVMG